MLSLVLGVYQLGYGFGAVHPCCRQLKLFIQNVDIEKAKFYFVEVPCRPTWKTKHSTLDSDAVVGLSLTEGGRWTGDHKLTWAEAEFAKQITESQSFMRVIDPQRQLLPSCHLSESWGVSCARLRKHKRSDARSLSRNHFVCDGNGKIEYRRRERNDLERKMLIYCKMRTKWNNPQPLSWHELFLVLFCISLRLSSSTVFSSRTVEFFTFVFSPLS